MNFFFVAATIPSKLKSQGLLQIGTFYSLLFSSDGDGDGDGDAKRSKKHTDDI
jgi:hypothetical protein